MRVFVLFLIATIIAGFVVFKSSQNNNQNITPTPSITGFFPTPQDAKNRIEIAFNNQTYNIFYSHIDESQIELIPNFSQKVSSEDLISEYRCKAAINGGFYTTENKPLGLFIANGREYSPEVLNDRNLLTGFFSLDESEQPDITTTKPQNSNIVIQSGPVLNPQGSFNTSIDEYARRAVIAEDNNDVFYLLMVTLKDDIYSGPLLSDLSEIIYSEDNPINLSSAINMDGGSASTFYDQGFHIKELSSIGSLLCIR